MQCKGVAWDTYQQTLPNDHYKNMYLNLLPNFSHGNQPSAYITLKLRCAPNRPIGLAIRYFHKSSSSYSN
ncbi:hypothetical protein STEG23_032409 [Scotinomys teguina]